MTNSPRPILSARVLAIGLTVSLLVAGCVSTQKRFDRGIKAEEEGRLYEASQNYIRVLTDDPDYDEARERLLQIAPVIVNDWMDDAARKTAANLFVEAHDRYIAVDRFIGQCGNVRARVERPAELDQLMLAADRRAFEQLMTRAAGASADGDFARAIETYDRARDWPSITEEQRLAIDVEIARTEYVWALRLFDDGQFRATFDHAQSGLALVAPNTDLHRELALLQERAVADGSVIVAYLPLGQTDDAMRSASNLFVDDLNDVLLYDYWAVPPVFMVTADPIAVRREMRRITGRNARIISRADAIDIGRAIDADYVVVGELSRYEEKEKRIKDRTYEVQTRGRNPVDTSYVVREATIERTARTAFRIYDVRRRSSVESGSVNGSAELKVERGIYDGNYTDLDLDGNQIALFDPEEIARQDQIIDEDLADELASKLAERVIDEIMKRIP